MSLKEHNQGFMALAHNLVFHVCTKYIDMQYYYIKDKVTSSKIDLQYMFISEIIADGITKVLIHAKFLSLLGNCV